jgi:hypothetical protein
MNIYATFRLPLDLTRRTGAAAIAENIVATFPGTRSVALDANGTVTFEMMFPGALSALMQRLDDALIPGASRADVSLPVNRLVPERLPADGAAFTRALVAGPEVWDPAFKKGKYVLDGRLDGDTVVATVLTSTQAMHELYDTLLALGLVVADPAKVLH